MDPSSLDKAISNLENCLKILDAKSSSLEPWLWVSTAVVALGVALEIFVVAKERRHEIREWLRNVIHTPEKSSRAMYALKLAGPILVTAGIVGELWVGVASTNVNNEIRIKSSKLVGLIKEKAALAEKEAADERSARVQLEDSIAWRKLSDRQISEIGQALEMFVGRGAYFTYPQGDVEAGRFMRNIMSAVHKAKWDMLGSTSQILFQFSGPAPNPTISIPAPAPPTGVHVRYKVEWSNPGESSAGRADRVRKNSLRRTAAEALASELSKRGFDAVANPDVPSLGASDILVKVGYRPEGPQGAAKLRAEAKTNQAKSSQIAGH
jgi:hypothetical protein